MQRRDDIRGDAGRELGGTALAINRSADTNDAPADTDGHTCERKRCVRSHYHAVRKQAQSNLQGWLTDRLSSPLNLQSSNIVLSALT